MIRTFEPNTEALLWPARDAQQAQYYWSDNRFYNKLDFMIEAFNILAGVAAFGWFTIGLKVWEPLADMDLWFVPKNMKQFRRGLYLRRLSIYKTARLADEAAEIAAIEAGLDEEDLSEPVADEDNTEAF